jgi:uncharacterized repeat protein (TIGR02543 family)
MSSAITSITIPASVTKIERQGFQDAFELKSVTFAPGSQLATIEEYAFYEQKNLRYIAIPASVTKIEQYVFDGKFNNAQLPTMAEILFLGNAPTTIDANAFTNVLTSAKAYIKSGATGFATSGSPARWNGLEVVVASKMYTAVSYDSKGGSAVATRDYATNITEPTAPARPGYSLAGWTSTDGAATTVTFPYAPIETSGITLYAKWTANTNAVTFNSKGGTTVTSGSFTTGGSISDEPDAPTRAGYTFAGWTTTDGGETTITFPYVPGETSGITLYAKWNLIPVVNNPAPVVNNPAPVVDNAAALAAADLAARTVSAKKTLAPNTLAKKVGVKIVSPKAKVTMTVAGSSKKSCAVVAGKLKTLKAGNCVVSFTVQEPKPAKGKQPKATKTTKTLVVK